GTERHAVFVGKRNSAELSQKLARVLPVGWTDTRADAAPKLGLLVGRVDAAMDLKPQAQRLPEDPVGRSGAERIAAPEQQLDLGMAAPDAPQKLMPEARFAHARKPRDKHELRRRVADAIGQQVVQMRQLVLASDAGGGLADEPATLVRDHLLADEDRAA